MVQLFLPATPVAAVGLETAVEAIGSPGLAYIAAMEYEPVVGTAYEVGRDMSDEGALGLERILASGGKSDAFADTEHMGVDSHSGLVKHH